VSDSTKSQLKENATQLKDELINSNKFAQDQEDRIDILQAKLAESIKLHREANERCDILERENESGKSHILLKKTLECFEVISEQANRISELEAERTKLYSELIGQEHRLGAKIEILERKLEIAVGAIQYYALEDNWEVSAIDDYCKVKTKLSKDRESFGEVAEPGLASKLVVYAGKRARTALKEIEGE
jgi:hypothetical protein